MCCAKILSQASPNLILESIIWQFYFLDVRPFLPRGFFTVLVAVAHGSPVAAATASRCPAAADYAQWDTGLAL